jgi:hypothetical protein
MGGDGVLDYSLCPTKDEPPANRQRKDGAFGVLALASQAAKPPTAQKRRTSSEGPRPKDRSRATGHSPWPDGTSAVHGRAASAGDEWTISTIIRQLGIDRAQIAMLNDTVENLNASLLQDAADMLEISKEVVDAQDFGRSLETVKLAAEVDGIFNELKCDIGHMGVTVVRVDAIEAEIVKMKNYIVENETRDAKVVGYLEQLNSDRPVEGQTIMQSFKAIYNDLEETKGHFAQHVAEVETRFDNVAVTIQSTSMGAVGTASLNEQQSTRLDDITHTTSNMLSDVNMLVAAHKTWNGKCHCVHVDENKTQIDNLKAAMSRGNGVPNFCGSFTGNGYTAPLTSPPGAPNPFSVGVRDAMGVHAEEPAGEIPAYI